MEALKFQRVDFGRFGDTKMLPPEEWIPALIELMKGFQKHGAIRSLDALLMNLCEGDSVAALMLKHVMEWQPHGIREDGAIWRSADEWTQYTGLSRSMVYNPKRRERLTAAGIKVWVEKAWGKDCLHFRIESARLTMNIGQLLGIGYHIAFTKLWRIVPAEVSQTKPPIPFPKAAVPNAKGSVPFAKIPLTESTTDSSTDNTTSVLFNSENFSVDEKAKYGVLPAEVLRKIFTDADTKKREGKLRKSRLAYLRDALKRELQKHEEQAPLSATPKATPPLTPPRIQGGETAQKPIDGVPSWWIVGRNQIHAHFGWADRTILSRVDFVSEDGESVIVSHPKNDALWVQRYQRNLERIFSAARGAKTVIRFEQIG
jgi:hypothetical protein